MGGHQIIVAAPLAAQTDACGSDNHRSLLRRNTSPTHRTTIPHTDYAMKNKETPLKNLANFFQIPPKKLGAMIFNTPLFYETLVIPKRRGGLRSLSVPTHPLRQVQSLIYKKILKKFAAHEVAHAYSKRKSILTNANKHVGAQYMLKMDIKNFFGSIKQRAIVNKFKKIKEYFDKQLKVDPTADLPQLCDIDCEYLAKLCTLDEVLPQGAITSPHLSNLIFFELDEAIYSYCRIKSVTYSRYSDDMIFSSSKGEAQEIEGVISELLKIYGFTPNEHKTLRLNPNQTKYVTGLAIENGAVRLMKKRRREIRSEFHKFLSNSHNSKDTKIKKETILGKLNFWSYIEPNCKFPRDAITKMKNLH